MRPILVSRDVFSFDFTNSANVRWCADSEQGRQESPGHSMEYYVNDETIARRFGHTLDELLADWIDVALACYLADRLATRITLGADQSGKH